MENPIVPDTDTTPHHDKPEAADIQDAQGQDTAERAEFRSVILTIDHTSSRTDDDVVQKFVMSTQDLTEAMLALFSYYDENHLLHSKGTIEQFQQAAKSVMPAFVYRTAENIQVIMAEVTWAALVSAQETILQASNFVVEAVGQVLSTVEKARGGPVPLLLLSFGPTEEG